MPPPAVHYATTADGLEIAYQVLGDGPLDVVIVPGWISNLDLNADYPFYGGYIRRFPRFSRTIVLDKRGSGVSYREVGTGSPEDRMDDVRAVMDAVGSERAALLGATDGGPMALMFAATYPGRVSALVLVETVVRRTKAPDYPYAIPAGDVEALAVRPIVVNWGTGRVLLPFAFDAPSEEAVLEAFAKLERSVGTPRSIARQLRLSLAIDARSALPLIEAPTLVLHRRGHPSLLFNEPAIRYVADHIRGARYVGVEGYGSWDLVKQRRRRPLASKIKLRDGRSGSVIGCRRAEPH